MNRAEFIAGHGEDAYERKVEQARLWAKENPERAEINHRDRDRKGGKHYLKRLKYNHTGLQGERSRVRDKHGYMWRPYKHIIAPESQIHHSWIPGTAEYDGVALVEEDQHRHGIIDVIEVLEGEITLFTEKEIANRGEL